MYKDGAGFYVILLIDMDSNFPYSGSSMWCEGSIRKFNVRSDQHLPTPLSNERININHGTGAIVVTTGVAIMVE